MCSCVLRNCKQKFMKQNTAPKIFLAGNPHRKLFYVKTKLAKSLEKYILPIRKSLLVYF